MSPELTVLAFGFRELVSQIFSIQNVVAFCVFIEKVSFLRH